MVARMTPEHRRYTRAVMLLMGGYVATLVGVNLFFKNSAPTGLSALCCCAASRASSDRRIRGNRPPADLAAR